MGTAYNDTEGSTVVDGARSPRPNVSSTELRILDGATLSTDELNYLDIVTLGTGAASKAVVLDASSDYTYPAAATIVHPSGATDTHASGSTVNIAGAFQVAGAAVTASAAELNKTDASVEDIYADGIGLLRIAKATYDFSVDGGVQSTIDLGVTIPANSIIVGGILDVVTTCISENSDAGSGAIQVAGAGDIIATETITNNAEWDAGLQAVIPVFTAATMIKTTSAANIKLVIATETWTAGKFHVILWYIPTVVNT